MSTTNILDLNNRVNALEKAVSGGDSAQANKKDIATEFSATTAYTAGCFVYYQGKLYQFNADHSAGAWDPTDVVEANVTDQIVSNKAAIDGLTASDVAYDNTDSGLTATDVQGAVDEVAEKMGNMRMSKLWENPNPTSAFESQNINLSSSDYDMLIVNYKANKDDDRVLSQITPKTYSTDIFTTSPTASSGAFVARRYISRVNNTQFSASDCSKLLSNTQSIDNELCIPLAIYGIKLT